MLLPLIILFGAVLCALIPSVVTAWWRCVTNCLRQLNVDEHLAAIRGWTSWRTLLLYTTVLMSIFSILGVVFEQDVLRIAGWMIGVPAGTLCLLTVLAIVLHRHYLQEGLK